MVGRFTLQEGRQNPLPITTLFNAILAVSASRSLFYLANASPAPPRCRMVCWRNSPARPWSSGGRDTGCSSRWTSSPPYPAAALPQLTMRIGVTGFSPSSNRSFLRRMSSPACSAVRYRPGINSDWRNTFRRRPGIKRPRVRVVVADFHKVQSARER